MVLLAAWIRRIRLPKSMLCFNIHAKLLNDVGHLKRMLLPVLRKKDVLMHRCAREQVVVKIAMEGLQKNLLAQAEQPAFNLTLRGSAGAGRKNYLREAEGGRAEVEPDSRSSTIAKRLALSQEAARK